MKLIMKIVCSVLFVTDLLCAVEYGNTEADLAEKGTVAKRKLFSAGEDQRLTDLVSRFGAGQWRKIAEHMENRTPKQCRDRWELYLNPSVDRSKWADEDEKLLISLQEQYGKKWSFFTQYFPKRTPDNIKNKWNNLNRKNGQSTKVNKADDHRLEGIPLENDDHQETLPDNWLENPDDLSFFYLDF